MEVIGSSVPPTPVPIFVFVVKISEGHSYGFTVIRSHYNCIGGSRHIKSNHLTSYLSPNVNLKHPFSTLKLHKLNFFTILGKTHFRYNQLYFDDQALKRVWLTVIMCVQHIYIPIMNLYEQSILKILCICVFSVKSDRWGWFLANIAWSYRHLCGLWCQLYVFSVVWYRFVGFKALADYITFGCEFARQVHFPSFF